MSNHLIRDTIEAELQEISDAVAEGAYLIPYWYDDVRNLVCDKISVNGWMICRFDTEEDLMAFVLANNISDGFKKFKK